MKLLITSFLIFLLGCSSSKATPRFSLNIEALIDDSYRNALSVHVYNFEKFYKGKIHTAIIFADIDGVYGLCNRYENGVKLVLIDKKFFDYNQNNQDKIEYIIFHELGHCELERRHEHGFDDHLMRNSVMNDGMPDQRDLADYKRYKVYYMEELFKNNGGVK